MHPLPPGDETLAIAVETKIVARLRSNAVECAAVIAVVAGIAARFYRLGHASLWFDEGYTAWAISLPIGKLIAAIRVDTAPPLHYLLLREWSAVFGRSESALRAMSALAAVGAMLLIIPVAYRIFAHRRATAIAATLFSLGYFQIAYSHEARFYTLMTLLGVAGLWAVLRAIDRPSTKSSVLVAGIWAAGLYTNNMMALYAAGGAMAWLLLPGPAPLRRRLTDFALAAAVTLILFAPWIPTLLSQSRKVQDQFWITRPDAWRLVRTIAVLGGINEQGVDPLPPETLSLMCVLLIAAVAVAIAVPRTRRTALALSTLGLGPIILVFVLSRIGRPIFIDRSFLVSSALFPLLLALPATLGRWPERLVLVIAAVIAIGDVRSCRQHWSGEYAEDWRGACAFAHQCAGRDGRIIFVANEGEMLYDFYEKSSDYSRAQNELGAPQSFFALDPPRTLARVRTDYDLNSLLAQIDATPKCPWLLVESHESWADPDGQVLQLMSDRMTLQETKGFKKIRVFRFEPRTK